MFTSSNMRMRAPGAARAPVASALPRRAQNVAASVLIAAPLFLSPMAMAEPQGPDSVPAPAQEAIKSLGLEQKLGTSGGLNIPSLTKEYLGLGGSDESNEKVKSVLSGEAPSLIADLGEGLPPPGPSPEQVLGDGRDLGKDAKSTVDRTVKGLASSAPKVDLPSAGEVKRGVQQATGDLGAFPDFSQNLPPPGPSPDQVLGDKRDLSEDAKATVDRTVKDLASSAPKVGLPSAGEVKRGVQQATGDLGSFPDFSQNLPPPGPSPEQVLGDGRNLGEEAKQNVEGTVRDLVSSAPKFELPSVEDAKRGVQQVTGDLGGFPDFSQNLPPPGPSPEQVLGDKRDLSEDAKATVDRTVKDLASSAPKVELPSAEEAKRSLTSATADLGNVEGDVKSAASDAASSAKEVIRDVRGPSFLPSTGDVQSAADDAQGAFKDAVPNVNVSLPSLGDIFPGSEGNKALNDPAGKVKNDVSSAQSAVQDASPNVNVSLPSLGSLFPGSEGNKALNDPAGKVTDDVSSAQSAVQDAAPSGFSLPNIFSSGSEADKAVSAPQEKVNSDLEATRRGADKVGGEVKRAVNDPEAKVNSDLSAANKQAKKFSLW